MKCTIIQDGTECGADVSPAQKWCGVCGGDIEIDKSKTKKCPNCSNTLKLTDKFCTGCRFLFTDVTKKIICEDKKEDGAKYLDGGNNQIQPDEINKDQTEAKNKDQTETKNKLQPKDLRTNETIENSAQKPAEKRGLAVVCSHSTFIHNERTPKDRPGAGDDHVMMKSLWKLYGCDVISCKDEKSNFYENELIDKIQKELEKIKNIGIFVFVVSSHGEEQEEKLLRTDGQNEFQHYFFTNDGQCSTQDLMNKIANIEQLENKLKIFIIQACRNRFEINNKDYGVEIPIKSENVSDLSGGQNDGTVHPDAKGYMPHEDEKKNEPDDKRQNGGTGRPDAKPDDKRQNDGIDLTDARGYMPLEDEDEEVIQPTNITSDITEAHGKMENEVENSSSEFIFDLPPIEGVPHCDNCVVMFASMSGKNAYSKINHQINSGGWLIKSVDKIMKNYEIGQQAHILDILVEINREVGTRYAVLEQTIREIPHLALENRQPELKTHVNILRKICREYSSNAEINKFQDVLDELAKKIAKDGQIEDSLNIIKDETCNLTEKFKNELRNVMLKSQSSFLHNLASDDEDLLLCRNK